MRPNGLPKLRPNDHPWSLGGRSASKQHNPTTSVLERGFEKTNSNAERYTTAPEVPPVTRNRPRVFLELLQGLGELEFALLHGEEEPRGRPRGHHRPTLLRLHAGAHGGREKPKHLLHLLRRVILATPEDIRLGAFRVAELVDLGLVWRSASWTIPFSRCLSHTMVPNVMRPTSAFSGSKSRLATKDSFKAARLSSSWHVSTTYRKMGGAGAGRDRRYSIVVFELWSSGGIAFAVMSL